MKKLITLVITLLGFSCLGDNMDNKSFGVSCNVEVKKDHLLVKITNNSNEDICIIPPYFSPASNLIISYKDESSGLMVYLNRRGSSASPPNIVISKKTSYSKEIEIKNIGNLADLTIDYKARLKGKKGELKEVAYKYSNSKK